MEHVNCLDWGYIVQTASMKPTILSVLPISGFGRGWVSSSQPATAVLYAYLQTDIGMFVFRARPVNRLPCLLVLSECPPLATGNNSSLWSSAYTLKMATFDEDLDHAVTSSTGSSVIFCGIFFLGELAVLTTVFTSSHANVPPRSAGPESSTRRETRARTRMYC